jgi:hypothetical protein
VKRLARRSCWMLPAVLLALVAGSFDTAQSRRSQFDQIRIGMSRPDAEKILGYAISNGFPGDPWEEVPTDAEPMDCVLNYIGCDLRVYGDHAVRVLILYRDDKVVIKELYSRTPLWKKLLKAVRHWI